MIDSIFRCLNNKGKGKKMRRIIILINIIILIISLVFIIDYLINSNNAKSVYQEISQLYYRNKESRGHGNNIEELKSINNDIVAWIYIPGTNINYPIVQTRDNIYYLDHDIHGNSSKHGSIFMDYRNNVSEDENIIIYGHHMRDGSMFGGLKKYKSEACYRDNKYIYLDTDKGRFKYRVFSVYITEGNTDYLKTSFNSTDEFLLYLEDVSNKSLFKDNNKFNGQEKLITLSTCSYEYKDARMVVHGYLVLH